MHFSALSRIQYKNSQEAERAFWNYVENRVETGKKTEGDLPFKLIVRLLADERVEKFSPGVALTEKEWTPSFKVDLTFQEWLTEQLKGKPVGPGLQTRHIVQEDPELQATKFLAITLMIINIMLFLYQLGNNERCRL